MKPYGYDRLPQLDTGPEDVRIVELLPGEYNDELHIRITVQQLSQRPEDLGSDDGWGVLSYTWGDSSDREDVIVEIPGDTNELTGHGTEFRTLSVTRNLKAFLRHFRSTSEAYMIWIDAISINQGTNGAALQERAWHVKGMHRIYHNAGVMMWLGEEADDSTFALEFLAEAGKGVTIDWVNDTFTTSTGERDTEAMRRWVRGGDTSREFKAVTALLARPWFERVWVKQEVLLADKKKSYLICGKKAIRSAIFQNAIFCLSGLAMRSSTRGLAKELGDMSRASYLCSGVDSRDISFLLHSTRSNKASDDRDRVYGCIGIISVSGELHDRFAQSIKVDYSPSNTVQDVYLHFALKWIEAFENLAVLSCAGETQGAPHGWPTWVPDWRCEPHRLNMAHNIATSHFYRKPECIFMENGRKSLQVYGRLADEVSKVHLLEPYLHKPFNIEMRMEWIRELATLVKKYTRSHDVDMEVECLNTTLCFIATTFPVEPRERKRLHDALEPYIRYLIGYVEKVSADSDFPEIQQPSELGLPKAAVDLLYQCLATAKRRRYPFLFTRGGYIGNGVPHAQPGDLVYILIGFQALVLLRKVEKEDVPYYKLIGTCSFHGLNWGEALLGPLPSGHIMELRYVEFEKRYRPYYVDTRTGAATRWDPRISWDELEIHPPMSLDDAIPVPPEEPQRAQPTRQYLENHCIELETLHLV